MSAQAYSYSPGAITKDKPRLFGKKRQDLNEEDIAILTTLEKLKRDLDNIYSSLDSVTDPVLIDSFIYERNALNMRYKFYLQCCKEKGIICGIF